MIFKKTDPHIIIFILLIFFLSFCQNRRVNDNRTVFRYNESQGIATLDPAFARNQVLIWPVAQLFNGLVQLNDTLGIEPCIAKNWTISGNGLEYTFILRNDVFFHDHKIFKNGHGRKVKASDFEFSFKRIVDPKTASPGSWIFSNIDFNKNDGFYALNDTVLKIYLKHSFPPFLGILTMQYCSVVPKEIIDLLKEDFGRNPVGTGPFMFKYWKDGEKLIFIKNPKYFEKDSDGNQLPYTDAVSISFVRDKQSEFLEFMKGDIDFLNGVHASYKKELLTSTGELNPKYKGKIKIYKTNYLNTEYLAFYLGKNIKNDNPLQYKEIRKAINYGFDRIKMMKYLRSGVGEPALSGFIPKGIGGYEEGCGYKYNPDTARFLVKKIEKIIGKIPELVLTTTGDYVDICEFIQHELSGVGLKIKIEVSVGATFRSSVANGKLSFFRGSWIADYPDAENYLALFYSKNFAPNGPNYSHFSNEKFDKMYEDSFFESDMNKRISMYKKMDKIILDEAVVVPLFYDQVIRFTRNNVEGLTVNPINLLELKKIRIIK